MFTVEAGLSENSVPVYQSIWRYFPKYSDPRQGFWWTFSLLVYVCVFTIMVLLIQFNLLISIMGGGVQLDPLGTAATKVDLLYQPRVIMMMEKLVEW
jgi:hypothetical protein